MLSQKLIVLLRHGKATVPRLAATVSNSAPDSTSSVAYKPLRL